MPRSVRYDLRIDWDFNGSFTDESSRFISAVGSARLAAPESSLSNPRGIVNQMTLTLRNNDGRYSPLNTGGSLYSYISGGGAYHAPMYLRVSIDGSNYYRIFTGVIKTPIETGPTVDDIATVQIDCRDRSEVLLSNRVTTTQSRLVSAYTNYWTEADNIAQWLTDAGYSSGTDYVVDEGLFVIPWAWLDDESPLEEIWALAAACGGRFYCDRSGVFRYENAYHWLRAPHTTSQETFTKSSYRRIEPLYDDKELYNAITVEVSERSLGAVGTVWEANGTEVIPADTTKTIVAKLRQPCYSITEVSYTAVTSGGTDLSADVAAPSLTEYAQRIEMEFTNSNTTHDVNLVGLSLTGIPIDGSPGAEERYESSDSFWNDRQGRTMAVRMNAWVQTEAQKDFIGEFLRDRMDTPRLQFVMTTVPGDPERNLGDLVTINDTNIMSSSRTAYLVAINFKADETGFEQTLTALDATSLYPASNYFIIGTTLAGDGVAFY
jgi:hypothetical protein